MNENEQVFLSYDEAVSRLVGGDKVHCYMNPGMGILLGADWERARVLEALRDATEIQESGEQASAMGHGIAAKIAMPDGSRDFAWFETKPN